MGDPFLLNYQASDLKIAAEFLSDWLPFLTRGLCDYCAASLEDRVRSLDLGMTADDGNDKYATDRSVTRSESGSPGNCESCVCNRPSCEPESAASESPCLPLPSSPKVRLSWADMVQEDELGEEEDEGKRESSAGEEHLEKAVSKSGGEKEKLGLSREKREYIRFRNVVRKKDYICLERIKGKVVNILEGLELHTGVFSAAEQKRIVDHIYELQEKGRNGGLRELTYSEPPKWMKGKGRVTIQFGCCYNYAVDKDGNPPGIVQKVVADPIPPLLKVIIRRLVKWHVLPPTCVPDSCIVNIYEPGDCIPPHIDNHDFVRPFCSVSFLSECNIVFGTSLKSVGPGEFVGPIAIPLPVGSVLVLNGNGADVAKHCVPSVPTKRLSITFRRMDESKRPFGFKMEPDLQDIKPLPYDLHETSKKSEEQSLNRNPVTGFRTSERGQKSVKLDKPTKGSARLIVNGRTAAENTNFEGGNQSFGRHSPNQNLEVQFGLESDDLEDERKSTRRVVRMEQGMKVEESNRIMTPGSEKNHSTWTQPRRISSRQRRVRVSMT